MRPAVAIPAFVVLLISGCAGGPGVESGVPESVGPSAAPSSGAADYDAFPVDLPGSGSFVAGVDMRPGVWFEETPTGQCEWFLGTDGVLDGSGSGDFVVDPGQTVEVQRCSVMVWQQYED